MAGCAVDPGRRTPGPAQIPIAPAAKALIEEHLLAQAPPGATPMQHPSANTPPPQPPLQLAPPPLPASREALKDQTPQKLCLRETLVPCPDERSRSCTRKEIAPCE